MEERRRGWGRLCSPSIEPPLSIFFHVEPVRNILINSNHNIGLVCPQAEDRERARERANCFLEWGGSWPLDVPSEPGVERLVVTTVAWRLR